MSFAAPLFLAALALLLPVLVAFLVRSRRRSVTVPSTHLWRRVAVSRVKNRRLRFLTRILALLACLGAVTLLAVAAARPFGQSTGMTVAIVVDVSASMEGEPMDEARRVVERHLSSRGATDRYALVAAGPTVEHLAGPTDDPTVLAEALGTLQIERGESDLGAAIDLGAELVRGWSGARVVVVTDGGENGGDPPRHAQGIMLVRHVVGDARDNLGITAFASRPPLDALDAAEREVLVAVASSSDEPRAAEVVITADDVALARSRVEIPPGEEGEVTIRVHLAGGELVVTVSPLDGKDDAVGTDDRAVLDAPAVLPPSVLLVGDPEQADGLFFARRALEASGIEEITEVAPAGAHAQAADHDLAVVLGTGPDRHLDTPTLYLATASGALPTEQPRALSGSDTALRSVDDRAALLRGVALDGISITRALAIDVPDEGRGLVELDGGTVVASGGVGQRRWVYLGIDPVGSDLVLRVAFPVLVANAVTTLRGVDAVAVAETSPRSEVTLREGALRAEVVDVDAPGLSIPASPPVWLAGFAALLLLLELAAWRKGWA